MMVGAKGTMDGGRSFGSVVETVVETVPVPSSDQSVTYISNVKETLNEVSLANGSAMKAVTHHANGAAHRNAAKLASQTKGAWNRSPTKIEMSTNGAAANGNGLKSVSHGSGATNGRATKTGSHINGATNGGGASKSLPHANGAAGNRSPTKTLSHSNGVAKGSATKSVPRTNGAASERSGGKSASHTNGFTNGSASKTALHTHRAANGFAAKNLSHANGAAAHENGSKSHSNICANGSLRKSPPPTNGAANGSAKKFASRANEAANGSPSTKNVSDVSRHVQENGTKMAVGDSRTLATGAAHSNGPSKTEETRADEKKKSGRHAEAGHKTILQSQALNQYILDTNVYPREHEQLRELRVMTAKHPWNLMLSPADEGQFLQVLLKLMNAKNTIEIGTYTGYSLLATALALPVDGKIIAMDLNRDCLNLGWPYIEKAGVANKITFVGGPALDSLDELIKNEENHDFFDFVFVDADKNNYLNYHERLLKLVKVGGVIGYDNTLWNGAVVASDEDLQAMPKYIRFYQPFINELNRFLGQDPRVEPTLLSIGDGITLCRRVM